MIGYRYNSSHADQQRLHTLLLGIIQSYGALWQSCQTLHDVLVPWSQWQVAEAATLVEWWPIWVRDTPRVNQLYVLLPCSADSFIKWGQTMWFNTMIPGKCGWDILCVIFNEINVINTLNLKCEVWILTEIHTHKTCEFLAQMNATWPNWS